jgi:hypothetical protein
MDELFGRRERRGIITPHGWYCPACGKEHKDEDVEPLCPSDTEVKEAADADVQKLPRPL